MNIEQYAETLSGTRFFADFERPHLDDLLAVCERQTLMTGHALWSTGEAGDAAYILVDGRLELSWRSQPHGQEKRQVSATGEWVGLAYLVHDWKHESSAYTLDRSEVLKLSRPAFQNMFDNEHPAAFRLTEVITNDLVREVRDANERMHEVFGHPAETLRMLRRRARESGKV